MSTLEMEVASYQAVFGNALVSGVVLLWIGTSLLLGFCVLNLNRRLSAREVEAVVLQGELENLRLELEQKQETAPAAPSPRDLRDTYVASTKSVSPDSESAYQDAIRLVKHGLTHTGELVGRCGISPGEAELIMRLHGQPAPSGNSAGLAH